MRVLFDVPPGWDCVVDLDWTLAVSPDAAIRVLATPLVPLGSADPALILTSDVPADCRVEPMASTEGRTSAGWTMAAGSFRVVDRDANTVDLRVGAIYQMLAYTGVVVARMPSHDTYVRARAAIDAILASARPHLWTHEPACVAQWFELEAR